MAFLVRLTALTLFLSASLSSFSQVCDCVNTGNCPVPVNDNGTYNGVLDVTVNGENDLGVNPLTSVCFTITHTWIGDLSVSLTSPSGVNYMLMADVNNNYGGCGMQQDNVDVCIVLGDDNPLTNNTEYVCNSAPCAAGTCCLTGDWTVACGGVQDPINGAEQAPNCDLNDFNVPGDPANGTWTLTVVDVCNMDTGTLDNFSLNFANGVEACIVCSADGGVLDSLEITSCFGDEGDLYFELDPNYTGDVPDEDYSYGYVVSQNGVVLNVDTVADLTMQPPGIYHVHGFSYLTADSLELNSIVGLDTGTVISLLTSTTSPFCADMSDNFVLVTIFPAIPETDVNVTVCEGECIMVGAQQVCVSGVVVLESVSGCDSIINVTLNEASANAIIDPALPPAISCSNSSVVLDGSASVGGTFEWLGPNGFMSDQPTITITEPGTYQLIVSNMMADPPCESSATVQVADQRVYPDLIIDQPTPNICEGDIFDLSALGIQDQNNTNPTITFHSGTPATPANELSSTSVSPANTTTYYVFAANGSCTDLAQVVLTVYDMPTANFSANDNLCTTDEATISYQGSALPNSTYNWDFDGGVAVPGTGPGPHTVTWAGPGNYTISLTVEQNGCTSALFTQDVAVEDPLPAPDVECSSTTSTIVFSWDDVAGASGYDVNVLASPNGNNGMFGTEPNTYVFINLNPGNTVTIEVEAIGTGVCGNSTAQASCTATDCPDVEVTIDPVPLVCIDNSTTPFYLTAQATGGTGNGDFIWSGDGVTISGNFDPEQVPLGTNTVTVDYYEDNCVYYGATMDIDVYETPLVAIDVPFYICSGEPVPIKFAGIADPASTFDWNFEGGTIISGSGGGPYEILWPVGGEYDITLTVTGPNGCVSETLVQPTILVTPLNEPEITCEVTSSTITFSWPIDPEASSYSVNFPNGFIIQNQSNSTHKIYHIINLNPGDVVPIEVKAIGAIPCGNVVFQTSCEVPACPDVELDIDPVADICKNPSQTPFALNATITGGYGNGIVSWAGTGIEIDGTFDPNQASIGTNNIILTYEEGDCFYTQSIVINVFETPTAIFSADAAVCAGDEIEVTYVGGNDPSLSYTWDFGGGAVANPSGPGPHSVSWPSGGTYTVSLIVENGNGCVSEEETFDVFVEEPIQQPTVSCDATTTAIVFSWNAVQGVVDSTITVSTAQAGTLQGNTYTIDGLQPQTSVDFELTLLGSGSCPPVVASSSCVTDACPDITLDIQPVSELCFGLSSPVQLSSTVTGSDGTGAGTWSGSGVNPTTGMFDPSVAGVGMHSILYRFEEDGCLFEEEMEVSVAQPPTASFSTDASVCLSDFTTVVFAGVAGSGAIFNWDFGGGTVANPSGPGPHSVSWPSGGAYTISLVVENNNGCVSGEETFDVFVEEPIQQPTVSCDATTSTMVFSWNAVQGVVDSTITVSTAQAGTLQGNTYTIDGLQPQTSVDFELTLLGSGSCPPVVVNSSCITDACPDITLDIQPVSELCFGLSSPVQLSSIVTGSDGTGSGAWSGNGVNPVTGMFDPNAAGAGVHTVVYSFEELGCPFENEIEIIVTEPPVASFTADDILCISEVATIVFDGTAGNNAVFNWNFGGGVPISGSGAGPYSVMWDATGVKTISLSIIEDGCPSNLFQQQIQIDPEIEMGDVSCSATTGSVVFTWPDVMGATGYQVEIIGQGTGPTAITNTSYTLNGLDAGEDVAIQVTPIASTSCEIKPAIASCNASPCDDVTLSIEPVSPICLMPSTENVDLQVVVSGLTGTGGGCHQLINGRI